MNLKNLRTSYTTLVESFKKAGVKLDEDTQKNLDNFMANIETKLNEVRDTAIRSTKKIVTERLDAEYKTLVESLMKHMQENNEIKTKIEAKKQSIEESKKLADAIDGFITESVKEIVPQKTVVDYVRMQKLEESQKALRDLLGVNEAMIEQKKAEIVESKTVDTESKAKIDDLQKKLDESLAAQKTLKDQIDHEKAVALLESKVASLPDAEAKMVRESLKDASVAEIKMKFKTVLESVRMEIHKDTSTKLDETENAIEQTNLEEAIKNVLEGKDAEENNDISNNDGTTVKPTDENPDGETEDSTVDSLEEGAEDVTVNESLMKSWISHC